MKRDWQILWRTKAGRAALTVFASILMVCSTCSQTYDTFNINAGGVVYASALQPDGSVLVGGAFIMSVGTQGSTLVRTFADGTLDLNFRPQASNTVYCLAVQPDGKILVGGAFTNLAGHPCSHLGRLNRDGSLDTTFISSADTNVYALALQPDGKILVGGSYTSLAGQPCTGLGRLNADGSLDTPLGSAGSSPVYALALQPDGKILVGGSFSTLGGQACANLGRLAVSGALDGTFSPNVIGAVLCLALQPDGRVAIGGDVSSVATITRQHLARVNADGSLDAGFNPGASSTVYSLVLQADGRILVGGAFAALGSPARSYLARLNGDGTTDATFAPAANSVRSLALQFDGKLLVGSTTSLRRLNATGTPTQILTNSGSSVTWWRGDTSPEVWNVAFDTCTNGNDWTRLGTASRICGGWQLTGVSLGSNVTIRARGSAMGGCYGGSGWLVESGCGPAAVSLGPADQIARPGTSSVFAVAGCGESPMTCQWYVDGIAFPGATDPHKFICPTIGSTVEAVVCNARGCARASAKRWNLNADTLNPGPNGSVFAIAVQTNGAFIIGGAFTKVSGQNRTNIARLNPDGTLDMAFKPDADGIVICFGIQDDGKIIVGGYFSTLAGQSCTNIGRLNPDGTLDAALTAPSPSYNITCLTVQPDGKILVGSGSSIGYDPRIPRVTRLNADGTIDTSFNAPTDYYPSPYYPSVYSIILLPDGRVLACGTLPCFNNLSYGAECLDGSGRRVGHTLLLGYSDTLYCSALQADGKVILGGSFYMVGQRNLARLNGNLSLDTNFTASANGPVYSLAAQADGKVLVGGSFTQLNGQPRNSLGRLCPDGSLDVAFDLGANAGATISCLAVQNDGRVLAGGSFANLAGSTRTNFGRFYSGSATTENFIYSGSTLTWLRDGACPEFTSTAFDFIAWGDTVGLGSGARISGGWQITAPEGATADVILRGHGAISESGQSSWWVDCVSGAPVITNQPASRTNSFGTQAAFSVKTVGTAPLNYLWLKDGVPLNGGPFTVGAQSPTLVLSGVVGTNAGSYSVVVTNSFGATTSTVATLRVVEPLISSQPASRTNNAGTVASFNPIVLGTIPLAFQWRRAGTNLSDGTSISGAHTSTLVLSNVTGLDAADYTIVASNTFGLATSAVATLKVIDPIISGQPQPLTNLAGSGATFNVAVLGAGPISYQWRKDGAKVTGGTAATLALTNVQSKDAGRYDVVVTNLFGCLTSTAALLTVQQPPPNPVIVSDGLGVHTNRFGFNVRASSGQIVIVEASTDLTNWLSVQTNIINSGGQFVFNDPEFPKLPHRFYRARLYDGPLPAPGILVGDAWLGYRSNRFGFNLAGVPGQTVVVETSTDLSTWAPIATNKLDSGVIYFSDPRATMDPRRFYRLRLQ
jgi:uncharacterized delta-60 repeat protein